MKPNYFLTIAILVLLTPTLFGQRLNFSDVKAFWYGMELKKETNDATKASSYELMRRALYDIKGSEPEMSEVLESFESFLSRYNLCEKFFFEAVKSQNGNVEYSRMLLYGMCGEMGASIRIVDFIKVKYKSYFRDNEKQEEIEQDRSRKAAHQNQEEIPKGKRNENSSEESFENYGLKNHLIVTIDFLSDSRISGTVRAEQYTNESDERSDFIGTIAANQLRVKFITSPPHTGEAWTDEPWRLKIVNGKKVLEIVFSARDPVKNKWSNYAAKFTPVPE